jgi:mycothiol synthase
MLHRIKDASDPQARPFLDYCGAHGTEHDESYIPGLSWAYGEDFPSFALLDDHGTVCGAAAAMMGPSFRAARRARIAILHACGEPSVEAYGSMVSAVAAALDEAADTIYLFLPENNAALIAVLARLGFKLERTACLMLAKPSAPAVAILPAGYRIVPLARDIGLDIAEFVAVRNRNFREVKGSVDTRPEDLAEFIDSDEFLPGGLMLVVAPDGKACGTLRVERDDEEGSTFIGTISVDREHRGKGLARALIRSALAFSRDSGFGKAFLSVNADNTKALDLYRKEGFSIVKAMSCLTANPASLVNLRLDDPACGRGT